MKYSKAYLDFHYQLLKPILKAAMSPIVILDITKDLKRHPKKHWRHVDLKEKTLIINHQAACWATAYEIARFDVNNRNWPGFSYHFFIETDGTILKCNKLTDMCYHAKRANYHGIGIALQGRLYSDKCDGPKFSYTHSTLDKGSNKSKIASPTSEQLISLVKLWNYLLVEVENITLDGILGHCDISPRSRPCDPGTAVMTLMQIYKYAQLKMLRKSS